MSLGISSWRLLSCEDSLLCGTKVHQPIVCAGSGFHVDALPLLAADTEIQVPQIVNGVNRGMFMYSVRVFMFGRHMRRLKQVIAAEVSSE